MSAGRHTPTVASVGVALALFVGAPAVSAAPHVVAPPGGGLDGVEVALGIDGERGVVKVRRCKTTDCSNAGSVTTIPIPIARSRLDLGDATLEVVPIGEGRSVVHARIADRQRRDLAFEALLAGHADEPIFAGLTGPTRGEDGDRAGHVILIYDRDERGEAKFVLVGETREDTRICGQSTTPLAARGIDPKTMQLRGATLHRIDKAERDGATRIVASARRATKEPLGRVLVATGGSAPGAQALTDGSTETTWSEQRPGDGHGEFATMSAPPELPIHALVVGIAPSKATKPRAEAVAPRTFFIATDRRLFHVTVPEDAWSRPGATYEIPLPEPIKTTCVAVVLDEAYSRGLVAPEVSLTEIVAVTRFDVDGAALDDVASELSGARGEEAAALLKRGGEEGIVAVDKRWERLDARGRALAVDVAASAGACQGPAPLLLTRALADKEPEVRRRALGRIERCGKAATSSLVTAVRSEDEPRRAAAAPLLATIAPATALEPLSEQLGKGGVETRRAVRGAFARAAASSPREELLAYLKKDLDAETRLDLLRAMGPRLADLRPESSAAIADILGPPSNARPLDMRTRWLVAQPLAHLARSPDATSGELTRLAELARRDPEWPVRARAVELAAGIPALAKIIVTATADPEPRVREAALRAIAAGKIAGGTQPAVRALGSDVWTFVRLAAAEALGALPDAAATTEALARALKDPSPKVRSAAIVALGGQRAVSYAPKIVERLDDRQEDVEVRALAATTLGTMCVRTAADRLTELALLARSPIDEADERLGLAAVEALGALHPADLEKRLAPLRHKDVRAPMRRAAERAISETGTCR